MVGRNVSHLHPAGLVDLLEATSPSIDDDHRAINTQLRAAMDKVEASGSGASVEALMNALSLATQVGDTPTAAAAAAAGGGDDGSVGGDDGAARNAACGAVSIYAGLMRMGTEGDVAAGAAVEKGAAGENPKA